MRKGFTLTELLVVIAIIAALSALVTPVAMKVSRSAKQTACLSNLRSIGVGLEAYLADNHRIFPELKMGRSGKEDEDVLEVALEPYVNREVFECPADEKYFAASGSSYFWNNTQSGLRKNQVNFMGETGRPELVPLVFDKEAFHPEPHGANFLYADLSASKEVHFVTEN